MVENQKRLSGLHKRQTKRKPKVKKAARKDTALLLNRLRFGMTPNINRMNAHNIMPVQRVGVDRLPNMIPSFGASAPTNTPSLTNRVLLSQEQQRQIIESRSLRGVEMQQAQNIPRAYDEDQAEAEAVSESQKPPEQPKQRMTADRAITEEALLMSPSVAFRHNHTQGSKVLRNRAVKNTPFRPPPRPIRVSKRLATKQNQPDNILLF